MVRFTAYDAGIRPREARARAGRVIVLLEDNAGDTAASLVIEHEEKLGAGMPSGRVSRAPDKRRGKSEMHLRPGRYRVSDISRPANQATLIVEP